ncbi:hypothetical protein PtA15_3A58 [Puccinia triticina]|uniref:Uncharacterized protein n=2 Tax=Puccinia triticina TaxID=208348 RepID=A0ABY7CBY4_9BASI|nr:uncharacterized protein PtA15_3A58 [Puccinia triticina]WAQ82694.1 hypothetical protein PtA15_3A58 [Puccinia triticina]
MDDSEQPGLPTSRSPAEDPPRAMSSTPPPTGPSTANKTSKSRQKPRSSRKPRSTSTKAVNLLASNPNNPSIASDTGTRDISNLPPDRMAPASATGYQSLAGVRQPLTSTPQTSTPLPDMNIGETPSTTVLSGARTFEPWSPLTSPASSNSTRNAVPQIGTVTSPDQTSPNSPLQPNDNQSGQRASPALFNPASREASPLASEQRPVQTSTATTSAIAVVLALPIKAHALCSGLR